MLLKGIEVPNRRRLGHRRQQPHRAQRHGIPLGLGPQGRVVVRRRGEVEHRLQAVGPVAVPHRNNDVPVEVPHPSLPALAGSTGPGTSGPRLTAPTDRTPGNLDKATDLHGDRSICSGRGNAAHHTVLTRRDRSTG